MNPNDIPYSGWKNYQTWNVALWLSNDEGLYDLSREHDIYRALVAELEEAGSYKTPDGVCWSDSAIDTDALDWMLCEDRMDEMLQEDREAGREEIR